MTSHEPVETTIVGLKVRCRPLKHAQSKPLLPDIADLIVRLVKALVKLVGTGAVDGLLTGNAQQDAKQLPTLFELLRKADVEKVLELLDPTDAKILLDILIRHDATLLSGTIVVMPHPMTGQLENYELAKDKDRSDVFDDHPEAYLPILVFAGRVTYERFFPGIGRRASATPSASS